MPLKITTTMLMMAAALIVSGCANMSHMKNNDIAIDQNGAHTMHKTPGN